MNQEGWKFWRHLPVLESMATNRCTVLSLSFETNHRAIEVAGHSLSCYIFDWAMVTLTLYVFREMIVVAGHYDLCRVQIHVLYRANDRVLCLSRIALVLAIDVSRASYQHPIHALAFRTRLAANEIFIVNKIGSKFLLLFEYRIDFPVL